MTWLDEYHDEQQALRSVGQVEHTLEALCAGLLPEDAGALREERAGILEFEAGLSREEAELRAGLPPSPAAGRCA